MRKIKTTPKAHNHIWREGPMPTEEKGKDALLASVIRCGTAGRWLRGGEIAWGAELEAEGKVSLCCGGEAATFIDQSNAEGQGRREATYPELACSALDSDEPDEREERCDSCGETSRCLMRGLCPMCYELNGGTHD